MTADFISILTQEGIPNPVIDIMNESNLKCYDEGVHYSSDELGIYNLTSEKLLENSEYRKFLGGKIFDIAFCQFGENGSDISEDGESKKSSEDYIQDNRPLVSPTRSPKRSNLKPLELVLLTGIGIVIGLTALVILQRKRMEIQSFKGFKRQLPSDVCNDEMRGLAQDGYNEAHVSGEEVKVAGMLNVSGIAERSPNTGVASVGAERLVGNDQVKQSDRG